MGKTKEEEIILKHYMDLLQTAYQRAIPMYTSFAGMNEQELAYEALEKFYGKHIKKGVHYESFGGYPDAERQMFCFLPGQETSFLAENEFPIVCIRFSPSNKKFGDLLNHRDYLGTIMGLGITRDQIGDILVQKDAVYGCSRGYIFCKADKADLIKEISRIKHTTVIAEEIDFCNSSWEAEYKWLTGSVTSFRFDVLIAFVTKLSRNQALLLVQEKQAFLNGRCCTENAKKLEEGDVFSVRGYGKYVFESTNALSKKGRYHITVKQYI